MSKTSKKEKSSKKEKAPKKTRAEKFNDIIVDIEEVIGEIDDKDNEKTLKKVLRTLRTLAPKPKKEEVDKEDKRPPSGYIMFSNENRAKIIEELKKNKKFMSDKANLTKKGDPKIGAVASALGEKWSSLGDKGQKKYNDPAKKLMTEWKKSHPSKNQKTSSDSDSDSSEKKKNDRKKKKNEKEEKKSAASDDESESSSSTQVDSDDE